MNSKVKAKVLIFGQLYILMAYPLIKLATIQTDSRLYPEVLAQSAFQ